MGFSRDSLLLLLYNDASTTCIYTLSLHDALPIYRSPFFKSFGIIRVKFTALIETKVPVAPGTISAVLTGLIVPVDRKSTRLNSSHVEISYAVFCLKKKTLKIIFTLIKSIYTLTIL